MHIHIGLIQAATVFATVLIFGFFWRILAGLWHDNALGQAMAFLY